MKEKKMKDSDELIIFQKEDNDPAHNNTSADIEKLDIDDPTPYPTRRREWWRLVKFLFFSLSAGIIQILSFTLLNELIHWPYWPSYLISLTLSVLWNFTLNRKFTFKSAANIPLAMLEVFGYYLVFTPLSTLGGNALTNAHWNEYLVLVITMVLNFVTEYLFCRFVVYRGKLDNNKKQDK